MKLIQYRFDSDALAYASLVGKAVQALFERERDLDLRAVYVEKGQLDKLIARAIDSDQVGEAVASSFAQSYSGIVDYSRYVSVKSNISCRFVVVEDDGLLRVCHAQGDATIDFVGLSHTSEDVSELLVKSDLFD